MTEDPRKSCHSVFLPGLGNDSMNQRTLLCRSRIPDSKASQQQCLRALAQRFRVVVNRAERLALRHRVSDLFVQHKADRRIDGVLLALAAAPQDHARGARLLALDRRYITATRARDVHRVLRARENLWVIDDASVSALQLDHLAEAGKGRTRANQIFR